MISSIYSYSCSMYGTYEVEVSFIRLIEVIGILLFASMIKLTENLSWNVLL